MRALTGVALMIFSCVSSGRLLAQDLQDPFVAQQVETAARSNIRDFSLELIPAKRTFFQGEIIALTLRFNADVPGVFAVSTASYDHSGRMSWDSFHLDHPEGTTDPLADYYRGRGVIGGGMFSVDDLDGTVDLPVVLNEWFRFDRPGIYRVYVASRRLYPQGDLINPLVASVTSTIAEFEIVPADPAWAASTLLEASGTIDRLAAKLRGDAPDVERATLQGELERALRVLRFLGTPQSARELVRHLALDHGFAPQDRTFELLAGLFGSPYRSIVITEMQRWVQPGSSLPSEFTRTLDRLRRIR